MPIPFHIRTLVTSNGERLPLLIDRTTGTPLFTATVYTLTEIRARNRSANTIEHNLRAILLFHVFALIEGIDIEERIRTGRLFTLGEIDNLVRYAHQPMEALGTVLEQREGKRSSPNKIRAVSLESHRQRLCNKKPQAVDRISAANRLRTIRGYLAWLTRHRLANLIDCGTESAFCGTESARFESARELLLEAIDARIPPSSSRVTIGKREGLSSEAEARMLELIDLECPENPWNDRHVRLRNRLIMLFLYHLGIRRGELLGLRVEDIDFRQNRLLIARRPDDPNDPRTCQPSAKTLDRLLPLSDGLAHLAHEYVLSVRGKISGARRHSFFFVETDRGRPISTPSIGKLFRTLRQADPTLLVGLSCHVLRHTWNDRFSAIMDKQRTSEPQEEKTRSYLMGWREGSGTAANYTRRHIRKRAAEASLVIQEQ